VSDFLKGYRGSEQFYAIPGPDVMSCNVYGGEVHAYTADCVWSKRGGGGVGGRSGGSDEDFAYADA